MDKLLESIRISKPVKTESVLTEASMSRNEMIDWIEDNWNTSEGWEKLSSVISAIGYDPENLDDSNDEEGMYANFSDEDLDNIISVLRTGKTKDGYDTSVKPQTAPLTDDAAKELFKDALKGVGSISKVDGTRSSALAIYDVYRQGKTYRVQIYKM